MKLSLHRWKPSTEPADPAVAATDSAPPSAVAADSAQPHAASTDQPPAESAQPLANPAQASATDQRTTAAAIQPARTTARPPSPATATSSRTDSTPHATTTSDSHQPPADTEPAEHPARDPNAEHPRNTRLLALLLSLTVLLTAVGVWCTVEARSTSASAAASNRALTDQPATAAVTSAISLTLNKIFSYTYDKTDVTENAAATLLRGHARDSYEKLFAQVRTMAPSQRLTLTSRVSAASVQHLTNDHAQLLVFLDQSATRGNSATPETAAAQLAVTAERIDGNWFVTDLAPR